MHYLPLHKHLCVEQLAGLSKWLCVLRSEASRETGRLGTVGRRHVHVSDVRWQLGIGGDDIMAGEAAIMPGTVAADAGRLIGSADQSISLWQDRQELKLPSTTAACKGRRDLAGRAA